MTTNYYKNISNYSKSQAGLGISHVINSRANDSYIDKRKNPIFNNDIDSNRNLTYS